MKGRLKDMRQYEMFELSFKGPEPEGSEAQVDVTAVFTCEEEKVTVKGFYAGGGEYKVRFYPKKTGLYKWQVSGVVTAEGEEECRETSKSKGMVRVDGLHFKHDNGSRYLPFGTTIYALVHQREELINTTMDSLKNAPFNKVRFCVFPKGYGYNNNEPEYFAYEKTDGKFDVHRPCYKFWHAFEERISQLNELGIEGDLILFHPYDRWGFAKLSKEECLVYLDYLIRRFAAYPNLWWSLANEYDLMEDFDLSWWADFAEYVSQKDPFGHLLSNHNCFDYWDFDNSHTTHCSIQDDCVGKISEFQKKHNKPVVFDECRYEGTVPEAWGNISAFEMVHRFWIAYVCGGYCTHGETYLFEEDKDEVLWWSKGGVLHGESPKRIEFLKEIITSLPGPIEQMKSGITGLTADELLALKKDEKNIEKGKRGHFIKSMLAMPDHRVLNFLDRHSQFYGHCGEEVHIRYYGRECTCLGELDLPENGTYKIEVIDIWEMIRTKAMDGVNGKVKVKMPGKEGIAIMATKE